MNCRWLHIAMLLPLVLPVGCSHGRAHKAPLFEIIVPSQNNPFFKTEAEAPATRARQLGYRARIDHDLKLKLVAAQSANWGPVGGLSKN